MRPCDGGATPNIATSFPRDGAGTSGAGGAGGAGGGGGAGAACGLRKKYQAMVAPPRIIIISFIVLRFCRVEKLFYQARRASARVLRPFC
jgi:hypothetical protein